MKFGSRIYCKDCGFIMKEVKDKMVQCKYCKKRVKISQEEDKK